MIFSIRMSATLGIQRIESTALSPFESHQVQYSGFFSLPVPPASTNFTQSDPGSC